MIQIKPEVGYEEACLLEIRLRGGGLLLFGCFYRSPTQASTSAKNNDDLNRLLRCISENKYSTNVLLVTLTLRTSTGCPGLLAITKIVKRIVISTNTSKNLHKAVEMMNPSSLDLLFTDEIMQVSEIANHAPLGKSDHSMIPFKFNCYLDYSNPKERYVYVKADFHSMRNYLIEIDWKREYLALGNVLTIEY